MKLDPYRLSILLAVLGLGLIQASSVVKEHRQTDIVEITRDDIGDKVSVNGEVQTFYRSGSTGFMEISDGSGRIKVVKFDSERGFRENDSLTVEGSVKLYHGELEIVADRIIYRP